MRRTNFYFLSVFFGMCFLCVSNIYANDKTFISYDSLINLIEQNQVKSIELSELSRFNGTYDSNGEIKTFWSVHPRNTISDPLFEKKLKDHKIIIGMGVSDEGKMDRTLGIIGILTFAIPAALTIIVLLVFFKIRKLEKIIIQLSKS